MEQHLTYIQSLVAKGGPDIEDYYDLDAWISEVSEQIKAGQMQKGGLSSFRDLLGDAVSSETMQGFVLQKPHGYAGDYEIIDRMYTRYVSNVPHLSKWDHYTQNIAPICAVRNRKQYFCDLMESVISKCGGGDVLNLASGPGRDMLQFFENNPDAMVHIDCIEQDQNAVNHASDLCQDHLHHITFHVRNALRFQAMKRYQLIWSAGLFDYFDDKVFVFMLKKLGAMLAAGGEIVIGNFSTLNPSRDYMELFEWHLHHRSPNTLRALAREAGFEDRQIRIGKEETGVNLFLHITKLDS